MRRQTKVQRFFAYETREFDINGLSATLKGVDLPNIDFGFGNLRIKKERPDVVDSLKRLDILQYSLSNTVNAIIDNKIRDQTLKKIIDAQIEMFQLTAEYMREDEVKSNALAQDWGNYWAKLINQTKKPIRWFEAEENITVASMFLPEQQLRWEKEKVESTSEYEDPVKYQYADCREKLIEEIRNLTEDSKKRCICVAAESGFGLTTLSTALCGKLAEIKRKVLHVNMGNWAWGDVQDVDDVIEKLFVSADGRKGFHSFPKADVQPLVLVFDGFNRLDQKAYGTFFKKLNIFLGNEQNIIAILFLNICARSRAHSELCNFWQGYELMNYDEKHGAKGLREKWCEKYAANAGNPLNAQDILFTLKQETNANLFQRMVHPTICTLVFRFFISDSANLPIIDNSKSSTELFCEIVQRVLKDAELAEKEIIKNTLPQVAYDLWQNKTLYSPEINKAGLEELCFFAEEEIGTFRLYDCFRDYFCAQYICNILEESDGVCNTADWFYAFGAQRATEDLLSFLYGFIQLRSDEWCNQAKYKLRRLLGNRLKDGWEWKNRNDGTANKIQLNKIQLHATNADIILIALLSSLGEKTKRAAKVVISDRECVNRWISQLAGGSSSFYLDDIQGLHHLNWIYFKMEHSDTIVMDAAFFLGSNFKGMEEVDGRNVIEWVIPKYLKNYMDANRGYARQMIERQDSVKVYTEKLARKDDKGTSDEIITLYDRLSRKTRNQFERMPARLECFEPKFSEVDIVSLLNELVFLYHPALKFSERRTCIVKSDRILLEKIFLRLFNNAEKYNILSLPIYVTLKEDGDSVEITVKNYTINIAETDKKNLKNYRFRAQNYLGQVGSGEGLWYCDKAAKALRTTLNINCEKEEKLKGYDLAGIACFGFSCFDDRGQVIEKELNIAKEEITEQLAIKNDSDIRTVDFEEVFAVFRQLNEILEKDEYTVLEKAVKHMKARYAGMRLTFPGTSEFSASIKLPVVQKEKRDD